MCCLKLKQWTFWEQLALVFILTSQKPLFPWPLVLFLATVHFSLSTSYLAGNSQRFVLGMLLFLVHMFYLEEYHPHYGFYDHLNTDDS